MARHTGSAAPDAPGAHAGGAHPIERAHLRVPERPSPPVLRYAPSPAAAHLVRHYWVPVWEIPDGQAWEQHVLQYPCCLVVVAGGDDPYERFYGVVRGLSKVSLAGRGWVVGTVLQPGVGWLLGQALTAPGAPGWSVAAITDAWVPLGTLAGPWPGVIAAVRDAVAADPHDPGAHRRAITSIETALLAEVTLGTARYQLPLVPDTLCILPDYNRFFVVARRALVYQFLPERERSITVTAGPISEVDRAPSTIQAERASTTPALTLEPVSTDMLPLPFDELLQLYPLTDLIEALPLCLSG